MMLPTTESDTHGQRIHNPTPKKIIPLAMKISLGLLALGTLTTWLVVGQFGRMLVDSLPYHHLHALGLTEMALEVVMALATLIALTVVALGLAAWWWRDKLAGLGNALQPVANMARNDFGFEWLNRQIVKLTQIVAETSRATQTGQLNWNVAGIVGGLVLVLGFIVWSL